MGILFGNTLTVLMYHHVGEVTNEKESPFFIEASMFAKQLDFIKEKGFKVVSLQEVEEAHEKKQKLPSHSILITLDDGYKDNYLVAFPIIKEKQIPVTIFLSTGLIEKDPEILTWEEIKEMQDSRLVSFASHGVNHKRLRSLNNEAALKELTDSKLQLEQKLGKSIKSFCYPFGAFDSRIRKLVFQAGYKMDYSTRKGINCSRWNGRKPLVRAHVLASESLQDFSKQLSTGYKKSLWNYFIKG